MKKISIAYFGSSDFSADFLKKLIIDVLINQLIEIRFVVTQPDRPAGRKQILTSTPVKTIAKKYGLKVLEIENSLKIENLKLLAPRSLGEVGKIKNLDLCLLYAYAGIIPQELLTLPKYGFWCLHPSLLPKYRGTSPMATALINGDKKTGVTIIKMDEEIDHGPIIAQESLTIGKDDKRPDLETKLTDLGFEMFKSLLLSFPRRRESRLFSGSPIRSGMTSIPQNHSLATYTKKLSKNDGFISFENLRKFLQPTNYNLQPIYNLFRGLYPWPGLWTILPNGKRLKIIELSLQPPPHNLQPTRVQLEGKNEVDFETFNKAYKIF